jgi:hypothetical protein
MLGVSRKYSRNDLNTDNIVNSLLQNYNNFLTTQWTSWINEQNFNLVYRDELNGIRSIKSETIINKDIKSIFDYVSDLKNKQSYDSTFDTGYTHQTLNDTLSILYLKHKGVLIISPRDFVVYCYKNYTEEKAIYLLSSTEVEAIPNGNKTVRGEIKYAGFTVEKISESKSKLTFFSSVDVKLSNLLVNTSLKGVSYCVSKIKIILEK